jgi:hypothetical protein
MVKVNTACWIPLGGACEDYVNSPEKGVSLEERKKKYPPSLSLRKHF